MVWMTLPAKDSMPSISGIFGWERYPVAVSRYLPVTVSPDSVATTQC
ncbi:Uncharacterised protein [Mycobacteroides abscessus subsp. abscessus]|nr:Uncharacterised protein [Mycobacteroides abscessus subsp. abscessus]